MSTLRESDLRDYARELAELHERAGQSGLNYRLLAERGEEGVFTPLPEGEECGQAKACYQNAAHRALDEFSADRPSLTYYEGLVFAGFPIEHAWCQDADGRVYELTLRHNDPRCGFCDGEGSIHPTEHWAYQPHEDDWELDEEPDIECEQCGGTGEGRTEDRTGSTYLGVPVDNDTLRRILMKHRVYGALHVDPKMVAESLAGVTE